MTTQEAVKAMRSEMGLSQQSFATQMGLSIRSVARYEAGGRARPLVLKQLAQQARKAGLVAVADGITKELEALAELGKRLASFKIEMALSRLTEFAATDAGAASTLNPAIDELKDALQALSPDAREEE
jgi:transcriptional regulator with XRE-family HTH domain